MLRFLCFTPEPWPTFRADVDILLGRELPRLGVTVDLVTARDLAAPWRPWLGGEAHLLLVPRGRYWKHLSRMAHVVGQLWAASRDRHDALQVRDMPLMATLALVAGAFKGIPVIYWKSYPISRGLMQLARDRRREGRRLTWIPTWLRGAFGDFLLHRVVLRRAAMIVVQSDRMRHELIARGVAAERMVAVPMGVDFEAAVSLAGGESQESPWVGRRVIGYLGTLDRPRRIDVLLQMLALMKPAMPGVLLLLVGDTSDKAHRCALERQADELGLSADVVITGWLPTAEAWRRICRAEVALSPFPRGELLDSASPTKVPEYLALGIPVVCNDNPDQQAIIEATGAGSCVPYSADAFATAVLHWLNMPPDQRARHRDEGRAYVRQCRDYLRIAQALAREYEARLAGSTGEPP